MVMDKEKLIERKIKALPLAAGVYIFKDKQDNILYIGKARSLRKRISSYFNRFLNSKTQTLVSKIADIDYILTYSEAAALIKEAALIREYLPAYNIAFRDDKSFPFICITKEDFPQISICRNPHKLLKRQTPKVHIFGPYTNAGLLRQALKTIRAIFGFRSCRNISKKPCLYYRIHLCPGPCIGKITIDDYQENIKNIIMFLEGRDEDLIKKLFSCMQEVASVQDFEEAARIRNQIQALESILPSRDLSFSSIDKEWEGLEKILGIKRRIRRIEAFDVSNIYGCEATASLVSFYRGKPDKNNYRRFGIKTVKGIDDYQMLKEVIQRRYQRLLKENLALPDLIIIDGGRGQLSVAKSQLQALKINIPVISIAKEKEEIYTVNRKTPIRLKPDSPALHIIQRIRDEAHRFAVAYHHILRRKKIIGK